jgi:hypothetical protein
MSQNNVPAIATINNATTGAEMPTQANTATFPTTAIQGATMQTQTNVQITTRTIVERIQDVGLELVNLEIIFGDTKQQLYAALGKCYDIYLYLQDTNNSAALDEFLAYYKQTNLPNTSKVSLVSKVLNCAFDAIDVAKRSAYKAVIQFAVEQGIAQGGLVGFINSYEGLQNTRLAKYAAARAKSTAPDYGTRLQQTQNYFSQKQLTTVPEATLQAALPATQVGEQFVLVGQRTADGQIAFNLATADGKAVNAVLNIMYSGNKVQIANAAKASSQTSFPPTGTAPVPPDSFAAGSYSTDALSTKNVVDNILNQVGKQVSEETFA